MEDITILVLGDPAEPTLKKLEEAGPGVTLKIAKTAEGLGPEAADGRVLYSWSGSRAEIRRVMELAPRLEWIHSRSAGLDSLLFPELIASPIPLTNGSGVFSQSLGEWVMTGALYFAKDIPRMLKSKAERKWDVFLVSELSTQTMGIVGHGDIGRAVARRAKAFGMRVLALRRDTSPRPGDEDVDTRVPDRGSAQDAGGVRLRGGCGAFDAADEAYAEHGGIRRHEALAVVMNVGRGPVIDEAAIAAALSTGRIRGAVLDVFEAEPLPAESPLWGMENVLISAALRRIIRIRG